MSSLLDNASVRRATLSGGSTIEHLDEVVLDALAIVIGAIPVAIELMRATAFGAGATIGLVMVIGGIIGLGTTITRRPSSDAAAGRS